MNLGYILFSPNGRIGPSAFWRGIIILVAVQVIITVLSLYGPSALAGPLGILSLVIIYPYLCVFGKRLHDAGQSAWLFLVFVIGYLIIMMVAVFMSPGFGDFMTQYMELAESGDQEAIQALSEQSENMFAIPSIIGTIISNGVLGFLAARLHSYPDANQYGPPPGGVVETNQDDFL